MAQTIIVGFGLGMWHAMRVLFELPHLQSRAVALEEREQQRTLMAQYRSVDSLSSSSTSSSTAPRSRVIRHQEAKKLQKLAMEQATEEASTDKDTSLPTSATSPQQSAKDQLQSTLSSRKFWNKGIMAPVMSIWFENCRILIVSLIILGYVMPIVARTSLSRVLPPEDVDYICNVASILLYLFWKAPCIVIIEMVNMIHLRKVSQLIVAVKERSQRKRATVSGKTATSSSAKPSVPGLKDSASGHEDRATATVRTLLVDRFYVPIFLLFFNLQGVALGQLVLLLLGNALLRDLVVFVHASLLYAFFVFDYYWLGKQIPFHERLFRMQFAWPYFLGFGLPLGVCQTLWPDLISFGAILLNVAYPLLLIAAYLVSWAEVREHVLLHGAWRKVPIADIYRPALWVANLVLRMLDKYVLR